MCFFPTEKKSSLLNQILLQKSEETGYPRICLCLSHKSIQFVLKKSITIVKFLEFCKRDFLGWRHGSHIAVPKQRNSGCVPTEPIGVELFTYVNSFISSNKCAWMLAAWVKTLWFLLQMWTNALKLRMHAVPGRNVWTYRENTFASVNKDTQKRTELAWRVSFWWNNHWLVLEGKMAGLREKALGNAELSPLLIGPFIQTGRLVWILPKEMCLFFFEFLNLLLF